MQIAVLGAGSWGYCLAMLLAQKGFHVTLWTKKQDLKEAIAHKRPHPLFPDLAIPPQLTCTNDLNEAVSHKDLIVESVTAKGLRDVFSSIATPPSCPIVITSKGIEQKNDITLPQVLMELYGKEIEPQIALLSGPSFSQDVIHGKPTAVIAASQSIETAQFVCNTFNTSTFRVYPNDDVVGVAFGGALKNVIAIACGICDALELGASARAALMTRGLHEIRKLAVMNGAKPETLNGLSGMGDLIVTCSSFLSRNYTFGTLLAQGKSGAQAKEKIGHVVEGAYTTTAVYELSQKLGVPMPINEVIYQIIYQDLKPQMGVQKLMQREIKEERL